MESLGSLPRTEAPECRWRQGGEGGYRCTSPNMNPGPVKLEFCTDKCPYVDQPDKYPELQGPHTGCSGCEKPVPQPPPPICIWEAHPGKWHRLVTASPNGCACKPPEFIAPHQGYMVKTFCRDAAAAQVTQYDHGEDEDD